MNSVKAVILGSAVASASAFVGRGMNITTTPTVPGTVWTTEVVTALTTYCPEAGVVTVGNKTYTVTEATTLTITDCPCTVHKPVPTGTPDCPKKCSDEWTACRVKPGANMASCASDYANCVGFVPTNSAGAVTTATTCASGPAPTGPAPTGTTPDQDCPAKCLAAMNDCKSKPGANMSFCTSEYVKCVGFMPTAPNGAVGIATVCSGPAPTGPAPTGASPPAQDCAAKCLSAMNDCKSKPGANMSFCTSEYVKCVGFMPTAPNGAVGIATACATATPTTTGPPVVTAAAGRAVPGVALLALGAVALL
ncbi:uncharacterized protein UV8b_01744 [Ustilaginoidea virens]|uniref:Uncharacterized protein n=1 Tax=Ustilaginoidea virens TaxID=1159556 RepID=A0A063BVI0_USTVR|nr:uncharacterized protein UV8b_01744 [Ustilaginoidea virens]QUC17503.1 hypothetical protein UV8b_01744 [Ustilaginoidea virens]GAO13636.1 hypothetical protein UVI_02017450 [Ustilaginoidea virens]